ncbi:MAG: hypothetical protein ACRYFV_15575 [Janthinobacterium lividum]
MLIITCPRVARAIAAGRRRSSRRAAWGSFSQRTIDRRYCGLPFIPGPASTWYPRAVRLAGGVPSQLVWQPLQATPLRQPVTSCHFCAGPIEEATSRCACFAHV